MSLLTTSAAMLLATSATVVAVSLIPIQLAAAPATPGTAAANPGTATGDTTIRPFRVDIPDEQLVDLRRRIAATRWPDQETVTDQSQGVPLATMQRARALLGEQTTTGKQRRRSG